MKISRQMKRDLQRAADLADEPVYVVMFRGQHLCELLLASHVPSYRVEDIVFGALPRRFTDA
jgi:hypothetical protein